MFRYEQHFGSSETYTLSEMISVKNESVDNKRAQLESSLTMYEIIKEWVVQPHKHTYKSYL